MNRTIFLAVALTFIVSNASAKIFECKIVDAIQLDPSGSLERTEYAQFLADSYGAFRFDDETGEYSIRSILWKFDVLQRGTEDNALKAVRIYGGAATKVVDRLQINTFSKGEFIFVDASEIRSGICVVIEE